MPQTYKFQVSMPVGDIAPRNRCTNVVHLEHVAGSVLGTDLEAICGDLAGMWQTLYGTSAHEVSCKAYELGPPPQLPKAQVTIAAGSPWPINFPSEVALCLSFAGDNRGDKRRRGRIYLMPQATVGLGFTTAVLRPTPAIMNWALGFYTTANNSLPDIGGSDWKFGIYSGVGKHFTQAEQAWVNDEWDTQRRRGLRETSRVSATREG